ncbi:MAG TPA: hypothetical protein QF624_07745 [Dehalococcoidia bacterium]|nr:hypothetical protein [Dehalococcoidia bacterium]
MTNAPQNTPHASATAHAPRPIDLVALVTFDDEVYENQAVTRQRLSRPTAAPPALNAAIEQWLVRRRHMWIDVLGRQINGIATARPLAANDTWIIDTLIDASDGPESGAIFALLDQALQAATQAQVGRVLLRTAADAPVLPDAIRSGFKHALNEQLWTAAALTPPANEPAAPVDVRERSDADAFDLFQLFNQALPIQARQALALTLGEWEGLQDRRWLGRNSREWVATADGRIVASLRLSLADDGAQFDLTSAPDTTAGAEALLRVAAKETQGRDHVLALIARSAAPLERVLRNSGLESQSEYVLLSRRTMQPIAEAARAQQGVVVSRGV